MIDRRGWALRGAWDGVGCKLGTQGLSRSCSLCAVRQPGTSARPGAWQGGFAEAMSGGVAHQRHEELGVRASSLGPHIASKPPSAKNTLHRDTQNYNPRAYLSLPRIQRRRTLSSPCCRELRKVIAQALTRSSRLGRGPATPTGSTPVQLLGCRLAQRVASPCARPQRAVVAQDASPAAQAELKRRKDGSVGARCILQPAGGFGSPDGLYSDGMGE